jgi:hypothetical protein
MAEEDSQPVDLWGVLDEAEETVEKWPAWQQRYEADVYREGMEVGAAGSADLAKPSSN